MGYGIHSRYNSLPLSNALVNIWKTLLRLNGKWLHNLWQLIYNGIVVASMRKTGLFDRCTDKFEVSSRFLAMAEVDFWCKSCLSVRSYIKPRKKPPFPLFGHKSMFINLCFTNPCLVNPCFINPCFFNPVHVLPVQSSPVQYHMPISTHNLWKDNLMGRVPLGPLLGNQNIQGPPSHRSLSHKADRRMIEEWSSLRFRRLWLLCLWEISFYSWHIPRAESTLQASLLRETHFH